MDAVRNTDVSEGLWTPSDPLPSKTLLTKLARRCLALWNASELLPHLCIVYNPRLSTALGRARLSERKVELNPRLLAEHPKELVPTLAHELAHLVLFSRYGKGIPPHGAAFRRLLRQLHLSDRARHDLPVEHLRRRRRGYLYLHRCPGCGKSFLARSVRRQYYCTACGPDREWDIFRAPDTAAGLALLERLRRKKTASA